MSGMCWPIFIVFYKVVKEKIKIQQPVSKVAQEEPGSITPVNMTILTDTTTSETFQVKYLTLKQGRKHSHCYPMFTHIFFLPVDLENKTAQQSRYWKSCGELRCASSLQGTDVNFKLTRCFNELTFFLLLFHYCCPNFPLLLSPAPPPFTVSSHPVGHVHESFIQVL